MTLDRHSCTKMVEESVCLNQAFTLKCYRYGYPGVSTLVTCLCVLQCFHIEKRTFSEAVRNGKIKLYNRKKKRKKQLIFDEHIFKNWNNKP